MKAACARRNAAPGHIPPHATDGSARYGGSLASRHAARRSAGSPPARTASRSDESDMRGRAAGSPSTGTAGSGSRQGSALLCHSVPEGVETRDELGVACAAGARPRAHDDVESRQLPLAQPEALADEPTNAIALDGAARDLRRDGEPEPRARRIVRPRDDAEESVAEAPSLSIRRVEVGLPTQAPPRGKAEALKPD